MAPITPYITEEIYQTHFKKHEKQASIHLESWPSIIKVKENKEDEETKDILAYLLLNSLKLLHPFMPFITEEIYSILPIKDKKLLVVEDWPA